MRVCVCVCVCVGMCVSARARVRACIRSYYIYFYWFSITACSHIYIDISGNITSPYYPERYRDNMNCTYTIKAVEGSKIKIEFVYLDVENATRCKYDSLKVHIAHNLL